PLQDHFDSLIGDLHTEEQSIQSQIGVMERDYQEANAILETVQGTLLNLNEKRLRVQDLRERLAARQSDRRALLEHRDEAVRELEKSVSALQSLGILEFDSERHDALEVEIQELTEKKTRADALRGECLRVPDLAREIDRLGLEGERCIAEEELILAEIDDLGFSPQQKREIEQAIAALMKPWEEHLRIKERLKSADTVREEGSRVRGSLETLQERVQGIEGEISTLAFDPDVYAGLLASYRKAAECHRRYAEVAVQVKEIPSLEERLRKKRESEGQVGRDLAQIETSLKSLDFKESELAETDAALQEKIEIAHRLEGVLSRLDSDIRHLREGIEEDSLALRRSLQYKEELTGIQEEMELLKLTRKLVSDFITYLLSVVRDRIEGEAGRILSEITDGRYDSVLIDEKFNMLIHDMGDDYPCSRFSGGEQDDIAIALRIALSRYLAEMHQIQESTFLIFDEIFGSQDEERRNNLIQALRSQESHFPQILIISHISEVQGEFASTLLVELMQNAESRVREVTS
ncbi:MAG TPA: SMC family ATPase, partial [Methanomicrobiales archaeon]|nr:SMC family ATPase [Methanomicrobiales archaeon]